jgi:LPXTG-motif cell wall-anchored protein
VAPKPIIHTVTHHVQSTLVNKTDHNKQPTAFGQSDEQARFPKTGEHHSVAPAVGISVLAAFSALLGISFSRKRRP